MTTYSTADISMERGMVTIMATRISLPTDNFTFLGFSAAPAPVTDIVITCVEETGAPAKVEKARDAVEKNCESNE
jgi:hypothetical protein